ncbi:DNA N-6-adenine-methyltransferase (Dam) [Komagataeibacter europaeus]|uniref:DNA N-6-adenine-methyltransferase (Dam) n=1 Tax=Komagataeibacter europaeus TaxID=33995 RepID=A0A0M0EC26_KOMEU|nr:DNA N-6-adenine-methyltransferase [Komagataeibacter europaeus]KON62800.1 DNA N-6-adenine-methyltransferase (Dam) [Komagataeibacter europaeus]
MILDHRSLTPAELRDIWRTDPRIAAGLFALLHPCSIDGCASDENHLLPDYFTREMNCLQMDWKDESRRRDVEPAIYFNPPFSKEDARAPVAHNGMANFFRKARREAEAGVYSMWLFRARPGELWFPWRLASRIWFIEGRVSFVNAGTGLLDDDQTENHAVAEFIPGEYPFMCAGFPLSRDEILSAGEQVITRKPNKYPILTNRYDQLSNG